MKTNRLFLILIAENKTRNHSKYIYYTCTFIMFQMYIKKEVNLNLKISIY